MVAEESGFMAVNTYEVATVSAKGRKQRGWLESGPVCIINLKI